MAWSCLLIRPTYIPVLLIFYLSQWTRWKDTDGLFEPTQLTVHLGGWGKATLVICYGLLIMKAQGALPSTQHSCLNSSVVCFCLSLNTWNKVPGPLKPEKETWLLRGKTNSLILLICMEFHGQICCSSFFFPFCHFESSPRWSLTEIPTDISTLG